MERLRCSAIVRDRYLEFRVRASTSGSMVRRCGAPLTEAARGTLAQAATQVVRLGGTWIRSSRRLAPLWAVFPSPLTLGGRAGRGRRARCRARCSGSVVGTSSPRRTAALLALAYLAYPWIAWSAVDTFHPVTLAIPLFLLCIWFLDDDRLVPFAVCAIPAALTGELMGARDRGARHLVARSRSGRRWAGRDRALCGAAWTWFALAVIVPGVLRAARHLHGAYERVGRVTFGRAQNDGDGPRRDRCGGDGLA